MRNWIWALIIVWIALPTSLSAQADCADAPLPRLQTGMRAAVSPGQSNNLREAPSTSGARIGQIPSGTQVIVLDGPVCGDGFYWYQVEYNNTVGWTVEGTEAEYWLVEAGELPSTPVSAEPVTQSDNLSCPQPRLYVGGQGYVPPGGANRVRREPSTSGEQVGQIFGGTVFDVLDGYICAGGYNWWWVQLGDVEGWTVEGDSDNYFVEPFTNSDNARRASVNSLAWSPDGRWLAVGSDVGNWVFDVTDFDSAPRRIGRPANSVSFRPDGVLVVAMRLLQNREYGFSFYDPASGELLDTRIEGWEGDIDPPPDPSFQAVLYTSEPGRYAYLQGRWAFAVLAPPEGTIAISQISSGARTVALQLLPQFTHAVILYETDDGGRVGIHELRSPRGGAELLTPLNTELDATSIALSADGERFAIGSADGQVQQWSFRSRRLIGETTVSDAAVQRLAYAPDGSGLAIAINDTLYVMNPQETEIVTTQEMGSQIVDIAYSPDGALLSILANRELWLLESGNYEILDTFLLE